MYITLLTLLSITCSTLLTRPWWSFWLKDKLNPSLSLIKSSISFISLSFNCSITNFSKSLNLLHADKINDSLFSITILSKSTLSKYEYIIFSIYNLHIFLLFPIYFEINLGSFLDNNPTFSFEIKFSILLDNTSLIFTSTKFDTILSILSFLDLINL